jgi:hypothetical protein
VGQRLNIWEYAFLGRRNGLLTEEAWEGWDSWYRSQIRQETWRSIWTTGKRDAYSTAFQEHVDAILSDE